MIKVIIVDDDELVRLSLKTIIEADSDIQVIAIGKDGNEAISLYKQYQPDILLMDIRMDNLNGIEAAKQIIKADQDAKILLLTTFKDDEYISDALSLGVKGYLLKQDYNSIIPALKSILSNQSVFNEDVIKKFSTIKKDNLNNYEKYQLTEFEIQLIEAVAQGYNNKEIALELNFSEGYIRNNISALLSKLNLRDRTQLAIFYYQIIDK